MSGEIVSVEVARQHAEDYLKIPLNERQFTPVGVKIARAEIFYDLNEQPTIYEFILELNGKDSGSLTSDIANGRVSGVTTYENDGRDSLLIGHSQTYRLNHYRDTFLLPMLRSQHFEIAKMMKTTAANQDLGWAVKIKSLNQSTEIRPILLGCSDHIYKGWFIFQPGGGDPVCEMTMYN